MKKSHQVLVTLAWIGLAQRAQPQDPCAASSFNAKVCKSAIRSGGYCGQNGWQPITYQESYSYYNDLYRQYAQMGGVATPAATGHCPRGGFGAHGSYYGAAS